MVLDPCPAVGVVVWLWMCSFTLLCIAESLWRAHLDKSASAWVPLRSIDSPKQSKAKSHYALPSGS